MKTPVVLMAFNRVDTTEKIFEAIRQAKPPKLLVIADSPRANKPDEADKCAAVRAIVERVDWDCEVFKYYPSTNLGPKKCIPTGLDWVFSLVEEAIILEHDCLPNPTFFRFCEELLDYYRNDWRVMSVCGLNIQFDRQVTKYSYYFSRYYHCWGWATWRRAWQHYDLHMKLWPQVLNTGFLEDILTNPRDVKYWNKIFQSTYEDCIDTWDYQWTFACWIQNGLVVLPHTNLICNIGFGQEATNTTCTSKDSLYADMATEAMAFPLNHPPMLVRNRKADEFTQATVYNPSLLTRARMKFNRELGIRKI